MTVVAVGSAAIVGTGYAIAPKGLPTLDLGAAVTSDDEAVDAETQTPDAEQTTAAPDTGDTEDGAAASGTFDGPVVTNARGDFQAQITVEDGVVVAVGALAAGTTAPESQRINAEAIPELTARVLEAQDWDVDAYSGASYTSPGFLESVHGAFDAAGL